MANLAGFDIIGELSIDTLRDVVNAKPFPIGNQSAYLLGGQFQLTLPITMPNFGTGQAQFVCTISLDAVPRTPNCRLTVSFSSGSITFASKAVYHVGGTAYITAGLGFISDLRPGAAATQIVPAVLLSTASSTLSLDPNTSAQANSALGNGGAATISAILQAGLQQFIRAFGDMAVPLFSFQVIPGQDSSQATVVTATPQVMWIDANALGIFAYYRAAASGGHVSAKNDSDIVQASQEFLYNQSGNPLFSVVEARRVAVLLSPDGFHRVIGCPLIRATFIRSLVHDLMIDGYRNQVHDAKYNDYYNQGFADHFGEYLNDELKKNSGENFFDAYNHVRDRIQKEADAEVDAEAERELNAWLDSPLGQAKIADSTPPECGHGTIQVNRQHMPDPFGDVITMLNSLNLDLGNGHIDVNINASGDLPICGHFTVTQSGTLTLSVNSSGAIVPGFTLNPPNVDISTDFLCKAATALITAFFVGITWGTVIAFGGFALAASIGEGVASDLIFQKEQQKLQSAPLNSFVPALPLNSQMKDIVIDPSGMTVIALIPRLQHFNDFRPRFEIVATPLSWVSTRPDSTGTLHMASTKWGCKAADFAYVLRYFDSAFSIQLNAIDITLPITIDGWQLELGNFSYLFPHVRDPRPVWSNEPEALVSPKVTLSGNAWFPVPPTDGLLKQTTDVEVGVTGSSDGGWKLNFRNQDGNFYVQISVQATDGDDKEYSTSTFIVVTGQEVLFGDDYNAWKQDCDRRYRDWARLMYASLPPFASNTPVPPGVPVENEETVVAIAVAQAIRAGDSAGYALLKAAVRKYGERIVTLVGTVPVTMPGLTSRTNQL